MAAVAAALGMASIGSAAVAEAPALKVVSVEPLSSVAPAAHVTARALPPIGSTVGWTPRYNTVHHWVLPREDLIAQANAGLTIPFWTAKVVSPLDKKTYTTSMVGTSPYLVAKTNTVITYVPFVIKLLFTGGSPGTFVIDPSQPGECDTQSVSSRFFNSPLFTPAVVVSNGVNVSTGVTGGTQVISAFQRANFWNQVHGTQYGVTLKAVAKPVLVTVTVPSSVGFASSQTVLCSDGWHYVTFGQITQSGYDAFVQKWVAAHSAPNTLPILLTYNTVLTAGGCCILGYHGAFSNAAGTHTYSVGSYIDNGVFGGVEDTSVWSHEMGEWMDDPFVQAAVTGGGADDLTPAWGHLGQVSGCQNNLEVGDPLSGTSWSLTGTGGFKYHFQDLTFHDWFYRTKSTSTAGKYSLIGTFTASQPKLCT